MKKNNADKNSIIAALFLFQYSLLIPLMNVVRPAVLIAFSGIVMMSAIVLINGKILVNIRVVAVIVLLVLIMLIKCVYDESDPRVLINFILISIPSALVYSYCINTDRFLLCCYKLSFLNFLVLCSMPFWGRQIGYMRFGYGMVLTVLFSYMGVFHPLPVKSFSNISHNKKRRTTLNIVVFSLSLIETIIYGNRGVLLVILSFIAIDTLFVFNNNKPRSILFVIAGFLAVLNLETILEVVVRISQKHGINTYAIKKYQYQLMYGLDEASSGRIYLYREAIETIKAHPFTGDKMITYDDVTLYCHNLFLQVGRDMGVIMMAVSIFFVFFCIYLLYTKKLTISQKTCISVFFCVSVIRLMISSNLWERPEFWALVCIVLNYKHVLIDLKTNIRNDTFADIF